MMAGKILDNPISELSKEMACTHKLTSCFSIVFALPYVFDSEGSPYNREILI